MNEPQKDRTISVGVLVNLEFDAAASGHVNVWKRYAEATAGRDDIDLTVYFLGPRQTISVADNVRYEVVPGALTTRKLRLRQGGGHADIGPYNRTLAVLLRRHDVLHTTDFFCFGATARRVAQKRGSPLIYSVHTLQPEFSRIYWSEIAEGLFGQWFSRFILIQFLKTDRWIFWVLNRALVRQLRAADRVLVFEPGNLPERAHVPQSRLASLRRGIAPGAFDPALRNPAALRDRIGIPHDRAIVLFVGRLDASKNAMLVADALHKLNERGRPVHGLFVGAGRDADRIAATLGDHATLTGILPHSDLPAIFASADLMAFPARYETWGNVVVEAKSSALPVLVAAQQATTRHIQKSGTDGLIVHDQTPAAWAQAIDSLLCDEEERSRMATEAYRWSQVHALSWATAVEHDLVPVWRTLGRSPQTAGSEAM
jgi:glycosyltransferase involved in cell wall biosynthesis